MDGVGIGTEGGGEVGQQDPLEIRCQFCPGQSFRRSRLRGSHLIDLLRMRYPVRCLRCNQRQVVNFTIAGLSLPSGSRRGLPALQPDHSWREWTENSAPVLPSASGMEALPRFGEETPSADQAPAQRPVVAEPKTGSYSGVERRRAGSAARPKRQDDHSVW